MPLPAAALNFRLVRMGRVARFLTYNIPTFELPAYIMKTSGFTKTGSSKLSKGGVVAFITNDNTDKQAAQGG